MATVSGERTKVNQLQNRAVSSGVSHESTCARCGGFMVSDLYMDLLSSTGEIQFAAKRCVQCGEVVDPVILRNRRLREESMRVQPLVTSVQSMELQVHS